MFRNISCYAFIILVCALSFVSHQRNMAWKGEWEFWQSAADRSPHKGRPHLNLGLVYADRGLYQEAMLEYQKTLKIKPDYPEVYNNMGNLYVYTKDMENALRMYLTAVEINPNFAPAYINAGFIIADRGDYERAMHMYEKALSINPFLANAHYGLAAAYETRGEKGEAIRRWQEYLRLAAPSSPEDELFKKNAIRHLDRLR